MPQCAPIHKKKVSKFFRGPGVAAGAPGFRRPESGRIYRFQPAFLMNRLAKQSAGIARPGIRSPRRLEIRAKQKAGHGLPPAAAEERAGGRGPQNGAACLPPPRHRSGLPGLPDNAAMGQIPPASPRPADRRSDRSHPPSDPIVGRIPELGITPLLGFPLPIVPSSPGTRRRGTHLRAQT